MWSVYNENKNELYLLCARRTPKEEWTAWTHTNSMEAVRRNIETIEGFGWQWKLMWGEDYE